MNPEDFFKAISLGYELGPTDKDYKVYVARPNPLFNKPRISASSNYQFSPRAILLTKENVDEVCKGFSKKDLEYAMNWNLGHWVEIGRHSALNHDKFYFQHLSVDQRKKFIELLNDKKLNIGYPGRFYVLPFFCVRVSGNSKPTD